VPEKPFNITRPSSEQIWACLQRCLIFEDPAARFERLQGLVRKQVGDQLLKVRDLPALPLPYQDYLFSSIYGANGDKGAYPEFQSAGVLLNVVLALADIARFSLIAFDSWKVSVPTDSNVKEMSRMFPRQVDDPAISELAAKLSLSSAQQLWLQHARRAIPDWSILMTNGPWTGDARSEFLVTQLKGLSPLPLDADGFLKAKQLFEPALAKYRGELPGGFLPNLLLLVEGETESILLPHFAYLLGCDFSAMGVMLVSAGGGKQVARKYFELRDVVELPIVLFTDADAGEEVDVAAEALRENDRLHIWKDGEIEDTLETEILVQQLNNFLQTAGAPGYVSSKEFPAGQRRTVILNRLWRARGLGNFDKIGFAEVVAANLRDKNQVPKDVVKAINTIQQVLQCKKGKPPAPREQQLGR